MLFKAWWILGSFALSCYLMEGIYIWGYNKFCWDFCEGHGGSIFYKRSLEFKSIIKTSKPDVVTGSQFYTLLISWSLALTYIMHIQDHIRNWHWVKIDLCWPFKTFYYSILYELYHHCLWNIILIQVMTWSHLNHSNQIILLQMP